MSRIAFFAPSISWAAGMLLIHGMPATEVHSILATDDPEIIHRHMELHRERLEERRLEQRRQVGRIELLLMEAIRQRGVANEGLSRRSNRSDQLTPGHTEPRWRGMDDDEQTSSPLGQDAVRAHRPRRAESVCHRAGLVLSGRSMCPGDDVIPV
jgi:hypothetical protein